MSTEPIIDRDTYRSINKISREKLQGFLMRYAENLTKDSPVIDLTKLEQDIKSIKGIGEKRAEEVMAVIEHYLGCDNIETCYRKSVHGTFGYVMEHYYPLRMADEAVPFSDEKLLINRRRFNESTINWRNRHDKHGGYKTACKEKS